MLNNIILKFHCQSCKKDSTIEMSRPSRAELENELGSTFYTTCVHCSTRKKYHVNDMVAVSNTNIKIIAILAVISGVMICTMLLLNLGFVSLFTIVVPAVFYFIYQGETEKSVSSFNRSYVPRERDYQPMNKKTLN